MDNMQSTTRIEDLISSLRMIQSNYGNIIVAGIIKNESNLSYIEPHVRTMIIHDKEGRPQEIVNISFS